LDDNGAGVIQAAAYGVGVCAQHCGNAFDAYCVGTIERLFKCIQKLVSIYYVTTRLVVAVHGFHLTGKC